MSGLAIVAALSGFKLRFVPAMRGGDERAASHLARAIEIEIAVLLVVLVITAIITSVMTLPHQM